METTEKNIPVKTIILGAVFLFLGFIVALTLFKYLTKPKNPAVAELSTPIVQQIEQQAVQQPEQSAVTQQTEVKTEELSPRAAEVANTEADSSLAQEQIIEMDVPDLVLNGIFTSETGSYALINNRIVREGETILGVKVVRIDSNKVVLDAFGKEMILRVQ